MFVFLSRRSLFSVFRLTISAWRDAIHWSYELFEVRDFWCKRVNFGRGWNYKTLHSSFELEKRWIDWLTAWMNAFLVSSHGRGVVRSVKDVCKLWVIARRIYFWLAISFSFSAIDITLFFTSVARSPFKVIDPVVEYHTGISYGQILNFT
jgi:hypothetical protein